MAHWFDRLCLRVAEEASPVPRLPLITDTVDRRGFLFGGLGSFAAALGSPAAAWSQPPSRPPIPIPTRPPIPRPILPGQCSRTLSGNSMRQSVRLTQDGVTFQRQLAYDSAAKSVTDTVTITQGATPVVNVTSRVAAGGAASASITYGPAVTGVRTASFTSPDGKTFTGTVDGRRVVTKFTTGRAPVVTEYLDHRPPSVASMATGLQTAVGSLTKLAAGRFRACHTSAERPLVHGPMRTRDYKPGAGGPGDPGDGWYEPGGTYNAPDCDQCSSNCNDTAEKYSGVEDWETYLCAPCLAAALTAYDVIWLACWGTCQLPGGGCCPVPCGGTFTCCGRNDNCFRGDLCCPSNMVVCNNVCCGSNISTCAADGTCGCPTGLNSCGESCCPPDQECCNGICVPHGGCNGGCASPMHPCGNQCCGPFSSCCNGGCCIGTCINGVCCPTAQACRNVCCTGGQVCNNGSCFGCGGGKLQIRRLPCRSLGPNNQTITVCCNLYSPTCCGGVCCSPGQEYCVASNGTYVCTNVNPSPIR